MGPEKHTAYAVQWFAMALALLGLFGYFGWHHAQGENLMTSASNHSDITRSPNPATSGGADVCNCS